MFEKQRFFAFFICLFICSFFLNSLSVKTVYGNSNVQNSGNEQILKVVDVSEIDRDGWDCLAVTFSSPLNENQNFEEILHLFDAKKGKVDGAWILSEDHQELIFNHLEPNRKLVLTVDAGLKGKDAKILRKEYTAKITTNDLSPNISFASQGSLFPVRLAEGLPVITLNVNQANVEFFRIKNDQLVNFFEDKESSSILSNDMISALVDKADLIYTGSFKLNVDKNHRQKILLPISSIKPLQKKGVYFAVMRSAGMYNYSYPVTVFTISDIGISVHRYQDNDQISVFTQSLETGDVLPNVNISALDKKGHIIATAFSDKDGYANLTNMSKARILLATQNGQTSFIQLKSPALDLSDFKIDGDIQHDLQFFVFGPRDLYRPGETVILNALLRDADGQPVQNIPVNAIVYNAEGKKALNFVWKASETGFYQYQLKLPANAVTGKWSVVVKAGRKELNQYRFAVEDFLPERMGLTLQSENLENSKNNVPLTSRQDLHVKANGWYLYGAPASHNLLSGSITMHSLRKAVPQLKGFEFGDSQEKNLDKRMDFDEIHLDQLGYGQIKMANQWQGIRSPVQLIIEASLFETGGRPVVRHLTQFVWPAKQLVGIRPLFDSVTSHDKPIRFEVVMADFEGHKLPAKNLKARFIHERHDYYWTYSDDTGWDSHFNKKDVIEDEQLLNIGQNKTAMLTFPSKDWGFYRLEVFNPDTGLTSSYSFETGAVKEAGSEENLRPDQVKVMLDKTAYKAGDIARITLTPPSDGKGYLAVESSGQLLWRQSIQASAKGSSFTLPINSKWLRHDVYITTLIIRPGDRKVGATPKRSVGILHLPLDRQDRKLKLQMKMNSKIEPLTDQKVKVKVTDAYGKPVKDAEVLLSAVDTGVLNITDYKTPDPFRAFFDRKAYNVDQLDVYGKLIEAGQNPSASLAFGGDAMAKGGKLPDTKIKIVTLQPKPIHVNDQGEAEISITVPDFNGELRIMGQVWTAGQFGMAENKITVAAPIVAEMSTPRFLAGGDETVLALDLTNMTRQSQELSVRFKTEGFIFATRSGDQAVILAPNERKTLKIPVQAKTGSGEGKIRVDVSGIVSNGKKQVLSRSWSIGTRPPYAAQFIIEQTKLNKKSWQISPSVLHNIGISGREGRLNISPYPPLNLSRQIEDLQTYPYECAEQTTSGIYPFLYVNKDILKQLNIKNELTDQQRHDAINAAIFHILTMQRSNGGFGLWSSDSPEEYWLTVYITDFLIQARDRGYMIPEDALQNALKRLLIYVQNGNEIDPYYSRDFNESRFTVQAYAGYVLARTKQVPLAALRNLYNHRKQAPSGLSLIQLSAALKLMGDEGRSAQTLNEGLHYGQRVHDWWIGDYGSDIRDNALILALLQDNHLVSDDVVIQRLFALSHQIEDKIYLSTQEKNAIFLAGYRYVSKSPKNWKVEVDVAGNHYNLTNQKSFLQFNDQEMRQINTLRLASKTGDVDLYPNLGLSGYPLRAPVQVQKKELNIEREFLDIYGNPVDLKNVKTGDLILVRIKIFSFSRMHDALVVDFLPAGFELENQDLSNASVNLENAGEVIKKSLEKMQEASIQHQEYRDDRYVAQLDLTNKTELVYLARAVTPGRYHIPSATLQSMYQPGRFARTSGNMTLIVKAR